MSKIVSILACCVVASMFSFDAQAFPGSPVRAQLAASEVTLVRGFCGHRFHRDPDGDCVPNGDAYGYLEAPIFGLPYVAPPTVGLPYLGPREFVSPRACPYGYVYFAHSHRCVPS
jgi:hypothetical protein